MLSVSGKVRNSEPEGVQGRAGHETNHGPGGPKITSLNWGPEQIRRWSNPVPHPLGEEVGPQPDSPALSAGAWGRGGQPYLCKQETKANHCGVTRPPTPTHSERRGHSHTAWIWGGGPQAQYFIEEETPAERGSDLSTPHRNEGPGLEGTLTPQLPLGSGRKEMGTDGDQAAWFPQAGLPGGPGLPPHPPRHRHTPFPLAERVRS